MIISNKVKNLLNAMTPLFERITFGDIIQRMQQDIDAGGGGGVSDAANVGTGVGVYRDKVGTILNLRKILAGTNMTATIVGDDIQLDASASGSSNYVFWPSAPVETGNVFKDWDNLMAAIAALPSGIIPTVTFRESFTVPSANMPVNGWDMRLGILQSFIMATGSIVVTVPDGVKFDNVTQISYGLEVDCAPTTADGVFGNSILGGLNILVVGLGAKLVNTGTKALMDSAGQIVLVLNGATQDIPPVSIGPFVKINGTDGTIAILLGDSPNTVWHDGWIIGGNPGAQLIYVHGVQFNLPNIPGWSGDAPIEIAGGKAANLFYDDTAQAPASGANRVQGVIDWLKTQIGGGGGGADQYEIVFDPAAATETDNLFNTFDTLMQRVALLSPEPVTITVRKPGLNQVISVPTTGMPGLGWDFEKVIFRTSPDSPGVKLDFADGTYMQQVPRAMAGLLMQFNETTAPIASITGATLIALEDAGFISNGSQPIFQVNGGFLYFLARGVYSPITKLGSAECVDIQSGSMQMDIITQSLTNGFLATGNQISGPGGSVTFNIYTLVPGGYNRTDANFSGTTTVNMHAETRANELIKAIAEPAPVLIAATGAITTERVVEATNTITLTLPDPTATPSGRTLKIKNVGVGTVTLAEAVGGVDGIVSYPMATQNQSVFLICNGAQWSIFASHPG